MRKLTVLPIHYPTDVERPRTRGDCAEAARPCPWAGCRHHLYLDVERAVGHADKNQLRINRPELDVDELEDTCSLDVAERGPSTLEDVAAHFRLTRERVRQIEESGLSKLLVNARTRELLHEIRDAGGFEPATREHALEGVGGVGAQVDHFGDEREPEPTEAEDVLLERAWNAYRRRSDARPNVLAGLTRVRPWESPGLTPEEQSTIRRGAVVDAYRALVAESASKPKMIDVARLAGLRGDSNASAATAQQCLRYARDHGVDLPHFRDVATASPPPSRGKAAESKRRIVAVFVEIARALGHRPTTRAVAAAADVSRSYVHAALAEARASEAGLPYDIDPPVRPAPAPEPVSGTHLIPRPLTARMSAILAEYRRIAGATGRRPSSGEIARACKIWGSPASATANVCAALRDLHARGHDLPHYVAGLPRGRRTIVA